MKQKLAIYALFVYENYILEDFSDIKPFAQKFIKILWFIKSMFIWLYSIIFFPVVLIHMRIKKYEIEMKSILNDILEIHN